MSPYDQEVKLNVERWPQEDTHIEYTRACWFDEIRLFTVKNYCGC